MNYSSNLYKTSKKLGFSSLIHYDIAFILRRRNFDSIQVNHSTENVALSNIALVNQRVFFREISNVK